MKKTIALRFVNVRFLKKPSLYALKTLNLKLTLPSLAYENPLVRGHVTGLEHLHSSHGLLQGAGQQVVLTLHNTGLKVKT
jgi:hypothetical protein